MRRIIILQGLPASGKSTWAKKKCVESGNNYKRVNKDDIRAMLDDSKWSRTNEKFVLTVRDSIIQDALMNGYDVIVDDTNLAEKHIKQIKDLAGEMKDLAEIKTEVQVKFFDETPETCMKRDLKRTNSVGQDVIIGMYNNFLKPKAKKYEPNKHLPKAILVDMDGTLAKMKDRSPYEWDKVDQDIVSKPVADLVRRYKKADYQIIILTGRDGTALSKTMGWLVTNNIPYDKVYIRPEGNNEKDSVIKERIFRNHIEKKYNVEFVLDDRLQVCRMWHEIGLTVLRVGDPDADF